MTAKIVAKRIGWMFVVLLVLSFAVFCIQNVLPADPVRAYFGRNATPELIAEKRAELGYDDPFLTQYVSFLGRAVQGDLGTSLRTRRPVASDIVDFLPATLELAAVAAVFAGIGGLALGIIGTRKGAAARSVGVLSVMGSSAPTFLLGIAFILLFYRRLSLFPAGGRSDDASSSSPTGFLLIDSVLHLDPSSFFDAVHHLVLPALCLAIGPAVAIGRTLRGSLRDALDDEHVRTARAKGITERQVVVRHGLRNSAVPTLSMAGLQLGLLIAGAIVVEVVFAWPGLGLYLNQSIKASDFPAVIGVVLVLGVTYVIVSVVVDLLQLVADPRTRTTA